MNNSTTPSDVASNLNYLYISLITLVVIPIVFALRDKILLAIKSCGSREEKPNPT